MQKTLLRKRLRQRREQLDLEFCRQASYKICMLISECPRFDASQSVGIYLPHRNEPDVRRILEHASCKQYFAPRILDADKGEMTFVPYTAETPVIPGPFAIPEPDSMEACPNPLDIILVPLLAFDQFGYRLGFGGGYYDRYLAGKARGKAPLLLGAGYAFQQVEKIEAEVWDVPLDGVVTEEKRIWWE